MAYHVHPTAFERSLWAQTAQPLPVCGPLQGRASADVVIIGGGYSGLSAALHLAEAGRSVLLLEAREPGFGASGRNAAGWIPNYLDRNPAQVEALLGSQRGAALNRMLIESARLVPELVARHGIEADIRRSGVLLCSGQAQVPASFDALRETWGERGAALDAVAPDELLRLTGTRSFRQGMLFRDGGTLNPLAYARGLTTAAARAGAMIHCGEPAQRIIPHGGGWQVETAGGVADAPQVLIATEGYDANHTLWPGLEKTVYHLPVAMVASQPSPGHAQRLLPGGIPIADANKANPFWMMRDGSDRIVASVLPPRRDQTTPARVAEDFERKLQRMHPGLPPIQWQHFWLGTVAISAERIPRLLRLAHGVHAIGGYSGQGVGAASAAGREYAQLVDSGGDEGACRLPIFDPRPVPLRRAFPAVFRRVLAPLARATDSSYPASSSLER